MSTTKANFDMDAKLTAHCRWCGPFTVRLDGREDEPDDLPAPDGATHDLVPIWDHGTGQLEAVAVVRCERVSRA